ncbi:glycogen debranching protein GlgX [Actinospica robiniae]|uniref:glycogen debranching protein GlgX n=1 Tax=Actinospica robiniae TaxID=304901 RepID=UPI000403B1E0|nr:glycogen debranching protein GlgX [Actinospica robiniae]
MTYELGPGALLSGRIDAYPTEHIGGYPVRPGRVEPLGATVVPGGVNFALYADRAEAVSLVLFETGASEPQVELPIPDRFRIGAVFAMTVFGLDLEGFEYGYRVTGPRQPERADRFDPSAVLMDPYARLIGGGEQWAAPRDRARPSPYRSRVLLDDFDWGEAEHFPAIPAEDLIVYEMHVRGFTRHPEAGVDAPGTYAGLREKIPYLAGLGVNCVELLPVFEFDETDNPRHGGDGRPLLNYWGYNTVGFFAPKAGYAATGVYGMQADEFKSMVKELHANGIEILLDVVFNHTSEGNELGPTLSLRGLGNQTYYMLAPDGGYLNFSGAGNTVNCNHPVVRDLVVDCLRYWVSEYHVDGFRFDLASILGRGQDGSVLANPPLLEALAHDPVLRRTKLVAEAWDAAGLYQVGSFPAYGRWSEWNGRYRDCVRRFLRGEHGATGELAARVTGSADLYSGRGATASVNFITAHDGFTLYDLVSYEHKRNADNGEDGRDGESDNLSWNSGAEGPAEDPEVERLRRVRIKTALTILLTSNGIPMLTAGDEVGRTQHGNNNAYCHDDETTWFDWRLVERNAELLRFTSNLIALRRAHPVLRGAEHPAGPDHQGGSRVELSWHGVSAWRPSWRHHDRVLALMRCGSHAPGGEASVYTAMSAHDRPLDLELPEPPAGTVWALAADSGAEPPEDSHPLGQEPPLEHPRRYRLAGHGAVVLISRDPTTLRS